METKPQLFVVPEPDRFDEKRTVARINGVPAFFPRDKPTPAVGVPIEVMITGLTYRNEPGTSYFDMSRPKFFFIRQIEDDDVFVAHSGFVLSGSMCTTTAGAEHPVSPNRALRLTPGRVGVRYVDHVSCESRGQNAPEPLPGWAWIKMSAVKHYSVYSDIVRIEGVSAASELQFNYVEVSK